MSERDGIGREPDPDLDPDVEAEPDPVLDPDLDESAYATDEAERAPHGRDPGSDLDLEGVPDVADESTPGTGEVPEPEVPSAPNEAPGAADSYGTTAWEQQHSQGLESRIAEETDEYDEEDSGEQGSSPEAAAMRVEEPDQATGETERPY